MGIFQMYARGILEKFSSRTGIRFKELNFQSTMGFLVSCISLAYPILMIDLDEDTDIRHYIFVE